MLSSTTRTASRSTPKRPRREASQNDLAYVMLRDALITLVYQPGEMLNIAELMSAHGMGRTPVNQALHRLSREGLVRILPRKGVVAAPLSLDEALDIVDVRLVNEALCMRLAADKATAGDVVRLQGLRERCVAAAQKRDLVALINADLALHEELAALSGNAILADLLRTLHARSLRFWALTLKSPGHSDEIDDEHAALIGAIAAHDPEQAAKAAQAHIQSFREALFARGEKPELL